MNILIAINSKYLIPARVMLTSLLENNKQKEDINIYLLHSSLKDKEINSLRVLVEKKYKAKLNNITVDKKQFEEFPISHHFTIETYYRFLAQSILPKEIDRILWLDVDMIVKKPLEELYYQDFEDRYIIVAQSINKNPQELIKKLGLKEGSKYFNAGMILFNLNKIRESVKPDIYFKYIKNNKEKITWLDQDVLNVIYNQSSKFVDYMKYNMQTFSDEEFNSTLIKQINEETVIIHYIGACKPWHFRYNNYCSKFYWEYAKKSEGIYSYIKFKIINFTYQNLKKLKGLIK